MQNNCTTSDRLKRFVFQRCRLLLVVNVKKRHAQCKYATLYGYETVVRWAIILHTPVVTGACSIWNNCITLRFKGPATVSDVKIKWCCSCDKIWCGRCVTSIPFKMTVVKNILYLVETRIDVYDNSNTPSLHAIWCQKELLLASSCQCGWLERKFWYGIAENIIAENLLERHEALAEPGRWSKCRPRHFWARRLRFRCRLRFCFQDKKLAERQRCEYKWLQPVQTCHRGAYFRWPWRDRPDLDTYLHRARQGAKCCS